jgi:mono/diheme cytochrome c family protein
MAPRTRFAFTALAAAVMLSASVAAVAAVSSAPGNAAQGKVLFLRAGVFCGSCHTLNAAKSTGRDGPNLDKTKPSYARIVDIVTKGSRPTKQWPTGMPGYKGELTKARIQNIAAFVYAATHK